MGCHVFQVSAKARVKVRAKDISCILFDWKKKEKGFLRSRGGCCWGARWLCWLFLCFALVVWLDILPKVACHGDDVGDDS